MLEPDPEIVRVVGQWVQKAEHDLITANLALKLGTAAPMDTIGFHAQQCVEKYLKALLVWRGIDFPKTHNITLVLGLLPNSLRPELTSDQCLRLTEYATVTRYPGDYEPITLAEVRHAVTVARRVRRQVRRWLPKQALAAG